MTKVKAHTQYIMNTGDHVPGVTTILNVLAKPALIKWANNLGLEGIDSTKYVDKLADIGTITHLMVMAHLTGKEVDYSEFSVQDYSIAENCMLSYYEWLKSHKVEPLIVEIPMASDIYGYGGTPDILAMVDGELELIDIKTGKAIWGESFYQVAAYRQILIERGYPNLNRARILRIGRDENEGFEERLITRFENEFKLFTHCLAIYNLQKLMRK